MTSELSIRIAFRASGTQTALLTLTGNLLKSNSKLLCTAFDECLLQRKDTIIIDLKKVPFIDNDGWKCITTEQDRLKHKNTALFIFGLKQDIQKKIAKSDVNYSDSLNILESVFECQKMIEFYEEYKHKHATDSSSEALIDEIKELKKGIPISNSVASTSSDKARLPVVEKITTIIANYGSCSVHQILKYLKSDEFGNTEISLIGLNKILSEIDLNSREKRERFYRAC
jgi:anti-anti-sigma regulatory factor